MYYQLICDRYITTKELVGQEETKAIPARFHVHGVNPEELLRIPRLLKIDVCKVLALYGSSICIYLCVTGESVKSKHCVHRLNNTKFVLFHRFVRLIWVTYTLSRQFIVCLYVRTNISKEFQTRKGDRVWPCRIYQTMSSNESEIEQKFRWCLMQNLCSPWTAARSFEIQFIRVKNASKAKNVCSRTLNYMNFHLFFLLT